MRKIAGSGSASGSIGQRHGSADPDPDPDPHQNAMDSQHCLPLISIVHKHSLLVFTSGRFKLENQLTLKLIIVIFMTYSTLANHLSHFSSSRELRIQ
jgi:hypothetical protein